MPDEKMSDEYILSEREEKLVQLLRELEYGHLLVMIADGKPVLVEETRKIIRL